MLAVAETSEQHGDKHCEGSGAKKCLFTHSYQLLLAMYTDRNEAVRREAINKIKKLRNQHIPNTEVEKDAERPYIDEDFLIKTEDEL